MDSQPPKPVRAEDGLTREPDLVCSCWGFCVSGWFLRSLWFTGNPIFPFGFSIFGGRNWGILGNEYFMDFQFAGFSPDLPRNIVGLWEVMRGIFVSPGLYGGYGGGLGYILSLGLFLPVVIWRKLPSFLQISCMFSIGFFLLWFRSASLQIRYLLPIAPLLALLIAYVFFYAIDHLKVKALQSVSLLVVCGLVIGASPLFTRSGLNEFRSMASYAVGATTEDAFISSRVDAYPVFRYVNSNLAKDSKVFLLPYENRGYYLDLPYTWGHLLAQRIVKFEQFDDTGSLAAFLRQQGTTHFIYNPNYVYTRTRFWKHDSEAHIGIHSQMRN